jgi:formylglycine-generating enzyme required for sulfatase activity
MNLKTSPPAAMFEKVLRAFETRGITYSDVLAQLRRQLAAKASPKELLAVLRRRESTERQPEYAHLEVILAEALETEALENEALESQAAQNVEADRASDAERASASEPVATSKPSLVAVPSPLDPDPLDDEVVVDLDFALFSRKPPPRPPMRASDLDLSVLARRLRSVDERASPRGASLEALTRSYERARLGESAAAEEATALAGDLEAVRTALETEQSKNREIEQALAQRNVTLDETRQELGEKEARIATLAGERTILETELEARARAAAQLEAELQAARGRAEAAAAELRARQEAAAAAELPVRQEAAAAAELKARQEAAAAAELKARQEAAAAAEGKAREEAAAAATEAAADLQARLNRDAPRRERDAAKTEREEPPPTVSNPSSRAAPRAPRGTAPAPWDAARATAWGSAAAAVLLLAGIWLFMHRSAAQLPPLSSGDAPNPGTVIRDCPRCPVMTVLPTGRFKQGSAGGSVYEQPLHWVVVGHPFAMSTNPVTLEDFEQFVEATGRDMQGCDTYDGRWEHRPDASWERPGFAQTNAHPVTCVSWNDAEAYAKWLSDKTGHRYRLPSASEWEYAARAGAETPRPWGSDGAGACALANVADTSAEHRYPGWSVFPCDDGYVYTAPVGAFKANAFGLSDMLGNVLQWTEDCWHGNYQGAPVDASAWTDGDCSVHEIRGGSWASNPPYVRANYRNHFPADYRSSSLGIRLVRDTGQ